MLHANVAEWQTRRSQVPVPFGACGFESHLSYQDCRSGGNGRRRGFKYPRLRASRFDAGDRHQDDAMWRIWQTRWHERPVSSDGWVRLPPSRPTPRSEARRSAALIGRRVLICRRLAPALGCVPGGLGSNPSGSTIYGPLAHSVEHLFCKQGVVGSNPTRSTNTGYAQGRRHPLQGRRDGFESHILHQHGRLAERPKAPDSKSGGPQGSVGSTPTPASNKDVWLRGRKRSLGKRVDRKVAGVRIPLHPPRW